MTQRYQINISGVDAHEASKALFDTNQYGFAGHNPRAIEALYRGALAHLHLTPEQARASDGNPDTPDPNADRVYAYYMGLYNNETNPGRKHIIADAISQFRYERRISLEQEAGHTQYYIPPHFGDYTTTIASEHTSETFEVPSGGWVGEAFTHASGAARRVQQAADASRESARLGALHPLDRAIEESVTSSDLNFAGINDNIGAMRARVKAILRTAGVDPETGELKPGHTDADVRLALGNANIRLNRDWNSALRIDHRDAEYALRVYDHMHPPAGQAEEIAPEEAAAPAAEAGAAPADAPPAQTPAAQGDLVLGYPAINPQVQLDLETLGKSTGRNNTNKFGRGATDMDGARGPATDRAIEEFRADHPELASSSEADVFRAIHTAAAAQRAAQPTATRQPAPQPPATQPPAPATADPLLAESHAIVADLRRDGSGIDARTGAGGDGLNEAEKGALHTRLEGLLRHLTGPASDAVRAELTSIIAAVTTSGTVPNTGGTANDVSLQTDLQVLRTKMGATPSPR